MDDPEQVAEHGGGNIRRMWSTGSRGRTRMRNKGTRMGDAEREQQKWHQHELAGSRRAAHEHSRMRRI